MTSKRQKYISFSLASNFKRTIFSSPLIAPSLKSTEHTLYKMADNVFYGVFYVDDIMKHFRVEWIPNFICYDTIYSTMVTVEDESGCEL